MIVKNFEKKQSTIIYKHWTHFEISKCLINLPHLWLRLRCGYLEKVKWYVVQTIEWREWNEIENYTTKYLLSIIENKESSWSSCCFEVVF